MRFSSIIEIIKTQWQSGDTSTVHFVEGSPGCGKSALGKALANDPDLGFERAADINVSLVDIPDVAGLALMQDGEDVLHFKKSPLLAPFQTGRNLLIFEEVPDAPIAMQNLVARLCYDRELNGLHLSPETHVLMFGNRSKDKSGAGRVSTKLSNRVRRLEMESNLDDWVDWALTKGNIDPVLIQYLRFKPGNLDNFQPDAPLGANPTPRAWERVNKINPRLRSDLFLAAASGDVGPGPAAEYVAFRKVYESLVSLEQVIMDPDKTPVPKDLAAQYAIVGSLAHGTNPQNVERVSRFIKRMSSDFGVMYWLDASKKDPKVKATKAFIEWAASAGNVILN